MPKYELDVQLDTAGRSATVKQKTTWTNPASKPAEELAFHVYPRFKIPPGSYKEFARLAQAFRLDPPVLIDREGRRLSLKSASVGGKPVDFRYDENFDTIVHVSLPAPVAKGAAVTVELEWELSIPPVMRITGQWKKVTSLQYWYPTLCVYGEQGWDLTPYIPWHQPYFQEMGVYSADITLPADQNVASSGSIVSEKADGGRKTLHIDAVARDFALTASPRHQVFEGEADGVKLRVLAFPEHERYARYALEILGEIIPKYNAWFGRYPFKEFTVAETYFGYHGNESSGLVMLDQRVFGMPWIGHRYFDQLLSHEVMHQWWYNVVGTNGFAEPFMDEGLVNHLTNVRMRDKYGFDVPLFHWPPALEGFPNLGSEDLAWKGYYRRLLLDQDLPILQSLPAFKTLDALFDIAYDKGGRVMGMIHWRMGDDAWFKFLKQVYAKYSNRILTVAAFRAELEAFTGKSWETFFNNWVTGTGICDWAIESVGYAPPVATDEGRRPVQITVRQKGAIAEPTDIKVDVEGGSPVTFRLDPERGDAYDLPEVGGKVTKLGDSLWQIELKTAGKPGQVEIDPEYKVLDVFRDNNRRIPKLDLRLNPLYLTIDDDPFFNPFDKVKAQVGPYVENDLPEGSSIGVKLGAQKSYLWRAYGVLGYSLETQEIVVGTRAEWYKLPIPNTTIGLEYLHSLNTDIADRQRDTSKAYIRYSERRFTGALYPDPTFLEGYFRTQHTVEEGFTQPGLDPMLQRAAVGVTWQRDTRLPYWDPVRGTLLRFNFENGFQALGADTPYQAVTAEAAAVHKLPDGLGYFSDTKLAGRIAGGWADATKGQVYQFGSAERFRGLYPTDRQGNAFWIAGFEYRFPILKDLEWDLPFIDNLVGLKGLGGAVFYDVGNIYQGPRPANFQYNSQLVRGGLAQDIGFGLRIDAALFSFLDRAVIRLDVAQDISNLNPRSSPVFWVSLQQAF